MTENMGKLLKEAYYALNNALDSAARRYDLTAAQMAMIDFLRLSSGKKTINQREIEQEFNIKSSTVTLLIDRMVAKNFIVRRESAKDKRVKEIFLTTKGFDISDVIKTIIQSHDSYVLNGYSDAERDVMTKTRMFRIFFGNCYHIFINIKAFNI